ncbi:MAG: conjugal transfer protein TraN [Deferribacterales bacterium]
MKHLILITTLLVSVAAHGAPWLCGETDVIYDSQSFCASACGGDCVEMTPDSGTCSGTYKNYAFDRTTNKTYALSVSKGKWADFLSGLAIIRDARTNDIFKGLLSFSGESEAWIGLYDPNMTQSFNVVNDTRFKWRDNTVLNYRNWAERQPDNKLNPADIGQTDIYGEHYGVINLAGLWSDAASNVMMNALVEFAGVQSCVSGTVPGENVKPGEMENAYCDGSSNCYLCTDNTDIYQCAQGEGGYLCPQGQQECNVNYAEAGCPAGTVLNPVTDKCETSPSVFCPSGMTYDSGLDRCVAPAVCSGGGILNAVSDKCETVITSGNCPTGYTFDPVLDICRASVKCPTGATYNSATDRCEAAVTTSCPSGYTYNSSLNKCQSNPVCSTGIYNSTAKKCVINATIGSCPVGYTEQGNQCVKTTTYPATASCPPNHLFYPGKGCEKQGHVNIYRCGNSGVRSECAVTAYDDYLCQSSECERGCEITTTPCGTGTYTSAMYTCPSGGTLSGTTCTVTETAPKPEPSCATGFTYDAALQMCVKTPTCNNGGVFNSSTNKCELTVSTSCPAGMTYNSAAGKCVASAVCSQGVYDAALDLCKISVSTLCPSGYSYDKPQNKCLKVPLCTQGSYSVTVDKCVSNASKNCPTGTALSGSVCQSSPSCQSGSYDSGLNQCFAGATCPSSGNPCVNIGGSWRCSVYGCYSSTEQGNYNNEDTEEGANDKKADGEVDEAGQCMGTIYIFNGGDRRCRKPGVQTGFTDCCKDKEDWFGLSECKPAEQALSTLRDWGEVDGQCHYVGDYCSEKWLTVCVQKKKTYCCFGSALARIIGEQGRQQLGIGWGTPKSPECRGFTPEEFQKLDFDKIDFSEWFEHYVEPEMQQNINENIRNAFENIPVPVVQ